MLHVLGAEDPTVKAIKEAREPEFEPQRGVRAAGGDAIDQGQLLEQLGDADYRGELAFEHLLVVRLEFRAPVHGPAELRLDLGTHVLSGTAYEPIDDFGLGQRPPQLGEDSRLGLHGEPFAVDQYAVAVEDHEVEAAHAARLRAPAPPSNDAMTWPRVQATRDGSFQTPMAPSESG